MTTALDRPEMGVEWRPAGEWMVSTPLYIGPQEDIEQKGMTCPHRDYQEVKRERIVNDETGPVMMVVEKCTRCGVAQRFRYRPSPTEESAQEIFRKEPPVEPVDCAGYERNYDFGTFNILVRRHDPFPGAPLVFMIRVDAGPLNYATMMSVPEIVFSQGAMGVIDSLLKVLRMGAERFANARLLQERRPRNNLPEMRRDAQDLFAVAQAVGKDTLERAHGGMSQEIEKEYTDARAANLQQGRNILAQAEENLKEMIELRESGQVKGKDLAVLTQEISQLEQEISMMRAELRAAEEEDKP